LDIIALETIRKIVSYVIISNNLERDRLTVKIKP